MKYGNCDGTTGTTSIECGWGYNRSPSRQLRLRPTVFAPFFFIRHHCRAAHARSSYTLTAHLRDPWASGSDTWKCTCIGA
jgi:hypothetical protein